MNKVWADIDRLRMRAGSVMGACVLAIGIVLVVGVPGLPKAVDAAPSDMTTSRVEWHPGIAAVDLRKATIVRIGPGFGTSDLAALRDDQYVETASGKRTRVGTVRAWRTAFAKARARHPTAVALPLVRLPPGPCLPLKPGETREQILARPPSDVVCMPSGRKVSVQQLRLAVPFMQHYKGLVLANTATATAGPVVHISNAAELKDELARAPDNTVLVTPHGKQATVGQIKQVLRARTAKAKGN